MKERQKRTRSASEALDLVLGTPEAALELALARLWRNWPEVLGQDMAAMIRPLGHRKETMLLGATNSMVMQEFSFSQSILDKANAFLGTAYFRKVQIELMAGRPGPGHVPAADAPSRPPGPAARAHRQPAAVHGPVLARHGVLPRLRQAFPPRSRPSGGMMRLVPCRKILMLAVLTVLAAAAAVRADDAVLRDYIPTGVITRFEKPVEYWIGGRSRLEGTYYVDTVMNEIRRIIPHLELREVSSRSQAGVRFFLTDSREEWQETVTSSAEGAAGWQEMGRRIRGFTRLVSSPAGSIRRADIVLHLDFQTSGGQKLWIVRHELMHALGVMAHPKASPKSVLNSHQAQEDKNGEFSQSDILVLQTMYDPTLSAGSSW